MQDTIIEDKNICNKTSIGWDTGEIKYSGQESTPHIIIGSKSSSIFCLVFSGARKSSFVSRSEFIVLVLFLWMVSLIFLS